MSVVLADDVFKDDKVFYRDTDSLYMEKILEICRTKKLPGEAMGQGKNDYGDGGMFHATFMAPKVECSLTIEEGGIIDDKKTIKGFEDAKKVGP